MEQQINQNTHLQHQNQQAYLHYCQQIITYLTVLNWLKAMYMVKESTIYNEKRTLSPKNLNQAKHQGKAQLKPLKHKEKLQNKEKVALGKSLARYEYDAYGNLLTQAGSSETPFGFTGYQKDEDTGLYYANARYYDSNTGTFLREDPLSGNPEIPPTLHRYNYAYSNPTRFIDPDGMYAEDGHYYTTLIVAEALGFTAEQSNTLALYSQLPDEVDNLDATELVKNKGLSMLFSGCIHCYRADEYLPFLHSLSGRKSEIETDRTVRAIVKSKDNLKSVGFLVHRLADTFAHRRLYDPTLLYGSGIGHGKDGHTPDVIQQNTEQYEKYVNTLISTLAQVKGGLSDKEIKDIKQKVHAKMFRLRSIPIEQQTKYLRKGGKKYPVGQIQKESNNDITESSIREAKRIVVEEINTKRRKNGKEPVNESYEPEKVGVDNFFGWDVWLYDALYAYEHMKNGKVNTLGTDLSIAKKRNEAKEALRNAQKILNATPGVGLREAEKSNKALMIIEGDDNEIKLKEDNDE
jgi:RHS repeat-associated protein